METRTGGPGIFAAAAGAALLVLTSCDQAASEDAPAREQAPRAAVVADWPRIPADAKFGQVSAVDVDSHGHVFVLHRAGRVWEEPFPAEPIAEPVVFMFDGESGELLARWGAGRFVMPHGLSVDDRDEVWITDVAHEQVYRFSHDGAEELALGEERVTGSDAAHFGRPTDIAFAGERVFISDGYLNSRVAVFGREGQFLTQWGKPGAGEGGLAVPHAISVADGKAYVADRENARIAVYDLAGTLLDTWDVPAGGHPYSLKPLGDGRVLSVEGRDGADRFGALLRIWRPDGTVERTLDAGLTGENVSLGHDIAAADDGTVYMADVYGDRVVKIRLETGGSE